MEGSVGLPDDSPIRERLFNTGCGRVEGGGCQKDLANYPEKITTSLCVHEKSTLPPSSYFIYTQI